MVRKLAIFLGILFALVLNAHLAFPQAVPLGEVVYPTAVISPTGTTTNAITTSGMSLVGCQMPATLTSTSISFTAATGPSGTYQELDNASGKVSYTVAQGKYIAINPVDFYGVQVFKIVAATGELAPRSFACSMKGL